MEKENRSRIIIILAAVALIAVVIWIYAKRIERLDRKMKNPKVSVYKRPPLQTPAASTGK